MARKANVIIYADCASVNNPGPCGWGTIVVAGGKEKEYSGADIATTSNRMEVFGILSALETLDKSCNVEIYTKSTYFSNAFLQNWLNLWKSRKWRNSDKEPVRNLDLWKRIDELSAYHKFTVHRVKNAKECPIIKRCEKLAINAVMSLPLPKVEE